MTTNEQLPLSAIGAPLAHIDRRSLSEAWYTALGCARNKRQSSPNARPFSASGTMAQQARVVQMPARHGRSSPVVALSARRTTQRAHAVALAAPRFERRAGETKLATQIVRVLHARNRPNTLCSIDGGETGRIAVMLRTQGEHLQIIAVCAKRAEAAVSRALEEARYALAARGIRADASAVVGSR